MCRYMIQCDIAQLNKLCSMLPMTTCMNMIIMIQLHKHVRTFYFSLASSTYTVSYCKLIGRLAQRHYKLLYSGMTIWTMLPRGITTCLPTSLLCVLSDGIVCIVIYNHT